MNDERGGGTMHSRPAGKARAGLEGIAGGPHGSVDTLDHLGTTTDGASGEIGGILVRLLSADAPAAPSTLWRLDEIDEITIGRASPDGEAPGKGALSIGLDDPYASTRHAVVTRQGARWLVRDAGSKNGTFVDGQRLETNQPVALQNEALLEAGHTFFLFRAGARGNLEIPSIVAPRPSAEPATLNPEWGLELERFDRLAPTQHGVLIVGESGVGKEVLARRLHERSGRSGPLVPVNCAALAESLLDDELFGHVRGAYSGAKGDREGLIRAAHRGTLFLDEVEEMPASLQAKLLRVLEDHTVRPIGSEASTQVDVRVIAAGNRDLRAMVTEQAFRADLLARLAGVLVHVPPLRRRREDLGLLIRAILGEAAERVRFDMAALRLLLLHPWPLNVRELRQALLVALDLAGTEKPHTVIKPRHLPATLRESEAPTPSEGAARKRPVLSVEDERLRAEILALLERHPGNVAAVARELNRPRSSVQRLMARLGIDRGA